MIENLKKLAIESGAVSWSRPPMRAITGLAFSDEALIAFATELSKANYSLFQEAVKRMEKLERDKALLTEVNMNLVQSAQMAMNDCCDLLATKAGDALELAIANAIAE